jgi:hypothetical protein
MSRTRRSALARSSGGGTSRNSGHRDEQAEERGIDLLIPRSYLPLWPPARPAGGRDPGIMRNVAAPCPSLSRCRSPRHAPRSPPRAGVHSARLSAKPSEHLPSGLGRWRSNPRPRYERTLNPLGPTPGCERAAHGDTLDVLPCVGLCSALDGAQRARSTPQRGCLRCIAFPDAGGGAGATPFASRQRTS